MLPRSTHPSVQRLVSLSALSQSCSVCLCRCGRQFRQDEPRVQTRHYAAKKQRMSPATWRAKQSESGLAVTPQEKKKIEDLQAAKTHLESQLLYAELSHHRKFYSLHVDVEKQLAFANRFTELASKKSVRTGGVEANALKALIEELGIPLSHCELCALILLRSNKREDRDLGLKLLHSLSNIGREESTIRLVYHAERSWSGRVALKGAMFIQPRRHLREIAQRGEKVHVMVLEGKVAQLLGDEEYAIQMYNRAMDKAVDLPGQKQVTGMVDRNDNVGDVRKDLRSPWIELCLLHLARSNEARSVDVQTRELEKAEEANDIGCQQDDPLSHYYAATQFGRQTIDEVSGERTYTSAWLYHIMKAAASGQAVAVHELGLFYANSAWKYLIDDPPDHIKPTPFDSYPPDPEIAPKSSSVWDQTRELLWPTSQPTFDVKEQLFHTAIFPNTAYERYNLGLQWLEVGMKLTYAPSFLAAANLLLKKTLSTTATAPKEAVEMRDERYSYATKADYLDYQDPIAKPDSEVKEIPNPGYNPERAKDLIREVFYAVIAMAQRRHYLNTRKAEHLQEAEEGFVEEHISHDFMRANMRKWFRFPEIVDLYVQDNGRKCQLLDRTPLVWLNLEDEAKRICDEQGWDIYAEDDGSLLYKYGMQNAIR